MPTTEEWRPVVGFPDYRVSDRGRVVSHRRKKPHLMTGKRRDPSGYPCVRLLAPDGSGLTIRRHRLVAEAFLGPRPEGLQTRHLDGNKDDCSLPNLAYGTGGENMLDQVRHGTHAMANRTHCPSKHPYDAENTRMYQGRRYCRACHRDRWINRALRAASVPTSAAA